MIFDKVYLVKVTDTKADLTDSFLCVNRAENIFADIEKIQYEYEERHKPRWRSDFKFEYRDVTREFVKFVESLQEGA